MEANPFELGAERGGPAARAPKRVLTEEERREKLRGYMRIPPDRIGDVRTGVHVRVLKKSGEFQSGGFVLANPLVLTPAGETQPKRFIQLQNGFNSKLANYAKWILAYEDLDCLYEKVGAPVLIVHDHLRQAVRVLNQNIQALDARLAALERAAGGAGPAPAAAPRAGSRSSRDGSRDGSRPRGSPRTPRDGSRPRGSPR